MKRIIIFIVFLFLILKNIYGADNGLAYNGTKPMILSIGYPPRILALHEADIVKAKNIYAGLYNPATLQGIRKFSFSTLHGKLNEDVSLYSLNLATPGFDNFKFNLSWLYIDINNIPIVTTENVDVNTDLEPDYYTNYLSTAMVGAMSFDLLYNFTLGLSSVVFMDELSKESKKAYGYVFTPGILYSDEKFSIGLYIENIFSTSIWSTGYQEVFPKIANLGVMYSPFQALNLFFSASSKLSLKTPVIYKIAFEYTLMKIFIFRLGTDFNNINSGLGISLGDFYIDYSYLGGTKANYSDSSRIALRVDF